METQLAKKIYHSIMATMKFTLNLEEYSYREKGREDPRYKTFKQSIMAQTYDNLRDLFQELEDIGLVVETEYEEDCSNGYKSSISGGSGYANSPKLDLILEELKGKDNSQA